MLRVSLLGNLGADPEERFTKTGAPMTTFRVAVDQVDTGPDGERTEHTEWFRVRAMGTQAERAKRLARGSRAFVAGRLDISHYQARDGEDRTGYDVFADEVVNLSARPPSDDGRERVGAATAKSAAVPGDVEEEEEEDLPF
jgi:single-strand DNA-binding protein